MNVCKRSFTSTKLDVCEYHKLWIDVTLDYRSITDNIHEDHPKILIAILNLL